MPTIAITGAYGLVGSTAASHFEQCGWQVIRLGRAADRPDIALDLTDPEKTAATSITRPVDVMLHAAAANEVDCLRSPYTATAVNVLGTRALLEMSLRNDISRFVYISTAHVFGNMVGHMNENSRPCPSNDYGMSHLMAEKYVAMYSMRGPLKTTAVRPTNIYGMPTDLDRFNRWTLTPFQFCRDAICSGRIELRTSGHQKRNFVSGNRVCTVIERIISSPANYPLVHISGDCTLSILQLAELVREREASRSGRHVEISRPPDVHGASNEFSFDSVYPELSSSDSPELGEFLSKFLAECSLRQL